jgi:hypothetical protein
VHCRSKHRSAFGVLTAALALSACSSLDFEGAQWFQKPLDLFGRQGGYTFSELQENRQQRPITANDLVQQNGSCPAAPAAPQPQANAAAPGGPAAMPVIASDADSLLGGGLSLGMSECDVVWRAGQPSSVQLGQNPNGDRTAVLTFDSGPRPGIYRFERGRLTEMDRVAEPPPPPQPKTAKKKPTKPNNQQSKNET